MYVSVNSCRVHGEARPHGAAPGEPINYRAVTPGRAAPVIDASCVAGEELSHAARAQRSPRRARRVRTGPGMRAQLTSLITKSAGRLSHARCKSEQGFQLRTDGQGFTRGGYGAHFEVFTLKIRASGLQVVPDFPPGLCLSVGSAEGGLSS